MFDSPGFFNTFFVIPILNILIALYIFFLFLKIPGALGFSLILLTVLIRLVLAPLTSSQMKNVAKQNKLKPQLDEISKRYKDDKTRLHQEQLKLYQQAGINPAAGCLPLLIQMPILFALYNLFFKILGNGNLEAVVEGINKVVYFPFLQITNLDLSFFGFNLAQKPTEWQKGGWWLLFIPVITGLLQYWQTKLMTPQTTTANKQSITKETNKGEKEEDMGTMMQKQMMFMMPLMIGIFAYSFPVGLSLYWNTFTVFGIIQQYQLNKKMES